MEVGVWDGNTGLTISLTQFLLTKPLTYFLIFLLSKWYIEFLPNVPPRHIGSLPRKSLTTERCHSCTKLWWASHVMSPEIPFNGRVQQNPYIVAEKGQVGLKPLRLQIKFNSIYGHTKKITLLIKIIKENNFFGIKSPWQILVGRTRMQQ